MNASPCRERLREGDSAAAELLRAYPAPPRLDASRVIAVRERLLVGVRRDQRRRSTFVAIASACVLAVVVATYLGFTASPERAIVVTPEFGGIAARGEVPGAVTRNEPASPGAPETLAASRGTLKSGSQTIGSAGAPPFSRRAAVPLAPSPALETSAAPNGPSMTETSSPPPHDAVTAPGQTQNMPSPAPEPQGLERESSMLADALVALRRERSPAKALARLDAYDSAFPRGSLRGEASVARVDALLALNRTAEALAQLQRLPIMSLPRSNELRVVRAELSARQGRCDAAITDANATLTQTPDGALAARAKQVLASCVSH